MGQYYNILTYDCKSKKYKIFDRSLKDTEEQEESEYMMAKLMEHSWLRNDTIQSLSNLIFENPTKIVWVGDYADESKQEDITNPNLSIEKVKQLYRITYMDKRKEYSLLKQDFEIEKMLLVNWDKKQYIKMSEYIKQNTVDGWCIHPLSLLTALGNGFGGGDYYGINKNDVGFWAFDKISFECYNIEDDLIKQNFTKMDFQFREE